jgi:hypothetical protein
MLTIDLQRVRSDLKRLAGDCLALKRVLRVPWTEPMGDAQRALLRARRRVTELHILCAHERGKHHLLRPPRNWRGLSSDATWDAVAFHREIAERVARDYAAPASAAVEGAPRS